LNGAIVTMPSMRPSTPDEVMTSDRLETKYLISPERIGTLARALVPRLPAHRYLGPGASLLQDAHHFATTVYFDTPSQVLWQAACADIDHNVKVRAREYYDLDPNLARRASPPVVPFDEKIWLELKRRITSQTLKHRFQIGKIDVPTFLQGGRVPAGEASDALDTEQEHILNYCRAVSEPLSASCLVNYRRLSFQDPDAMLRVTIDLDVTFYSPPADLWTRTCALLPSTLGAPRGHEPRAVVEVKRRMALPAWLEAAIDDAHGEPTSFSKFLHAGEAVASAG
jgi:hypothetical protein